MPTKAGISVMVTMTVMVEVRDSWGPDCPVGQVAKQAAASADRSLRMALSNGDEVTSNEESRKEARRRIRLVRDSMLVDVHHTGIKP